MRGGFGESFRDIQRSPRLFLRYTGTGTTSATAKLFVGSKSFAPENANAHKQAQENVHPSRLGPKPQTPREKATETAQGNPPLSGFANTSAV